MIEFKSMKVNTDTKEVYIDNNPVKLTKSEYKLLVFFLTHQKKVYTKKDILQSIGIINVTLDYLSTLVSRLRRKIGVIGSYITTKTGFGYGFNIV